jgi:RNA polymerase sigma-70 factor (ECF subfamily)
MEEHQPKPDLNLTPETVFREYAPRVYSVARRMMGNDADAEDVTQDVLLQVIRKLDTFRGEAQFPTWLHRVTVNTALAHREKRARLHRLEHGLETSSNYDPLDQFSGNGHHSKPVSRWNIEPSQQAISRETHDLLEKAIDQMPETYRDVYVLADMEGLSNAEVGEILGLSLPAVKSRLHRGRLLLRNTLAPHFEEMKA